MTEKKWRNELEEKEFEKNLFRADPVFANVNLLGNCNVDCYFCLGKDINEEFKKFKHTSIHFSEWPNFEYFLKRCEEAQIKRIYLTGQNTDSLLYKHLDEFIDYVQNRGFDVGLRTNGYLSKSKLDQINKCRRNVGYSIHSLIPENNYKIMRRKDIPDWDTIIPSTKNVRVSIVLNRYNKDEFYDLIKYISKFDNVKYIQVRRICTDTREKYLIEDVNVYEEVFQSVQNNFKEIGTFYNAEEFEMFGKRVCFWRTVKTSIDSFNYYTDGTFNDEYFVIEGYMRDSSTYPKVDDTPQKIKGLEGYWREDRNIS